MKNFLILSLLLSAAVSFADPVDDQIKKCSNLSDAANLAKKNLRNQFGLRAILGQSCPGDAPSCDARDLRDDSRWDTEFFNAWLTSSSSTGNLGGLVEVFELVTAAQEKMIVQGCGSGFGRKLDGTFEVDAQSKNFDAAALKLFKLTLEHAKSPSLQDLLLGFVNLKAIISYPNRHIH